MRKPYKPMKDSTLIQRLGPPSKNGMMNPFSFGAGSSGLTENAMQLLAPIFSFDYMMAGEYENGSVQRALFRIGEDAQDFEAFVMEIPQSQIEKNWREAVANLSKDGKKRKRYNAAEKKYEKAEALRLGFEDPAKVYVFCHKNERTAVENVIHALAMNRYRTRDAVMLHSALRPMDDYDRERIGWLELNNGFLFFSNEEAWKKTVALFQREDETVPPIPKEVPTRRPEA